MRLKDIAYINRCELSEATDPDYSFKYVDISAVDACGGVCTSGAPIRFAAAPSRARRLAPPGSTVVATVRTYLRAIAHVPQASDPLVFSTGFAVMEAKPVTDPRFLTYVCRSEPFVGQVVARSTGVSYPAITPNDLAAIHVQLPSLDSQLRIADFLDGELRRIADVENARSKVIAILDERDSASIRTVLENGLASRFRTEPSAIPWLARHPKGWRSAPLRYISRIQRGASPRPIDDPVYFDVDGSHGWVRISDVTASQKYLKSTEQRLSPLGKSLSVPIAPGELILSIAATVGKPIIAKMHCCIHDGFVAIRRPQLDPDFLYYVLLLGDAFRGLGKLGTQLNLNSHTVGSIIIPIPPAEEQPLLAAQIESALQGTSCQRLATAQQLALLAERRQALITAAVTGQIDVTTARGVGV